MDIGKLLGINIDPKKFNEYLGAVLVRIDKVATAWERCAVAQERIANAQEAQRVSLDKIAYGLGKLVELKPKK